MNSKKNIKGQEKTFERDMLDSRKSSVRRYRIFRPKDDPSHVIIDPEFDKPENA